jgi:hypothetical protein
MSSSRRVPIQIQNGSMYIIINLKKLVLGFTLLGAIATISLVAKASGESTTQTPNTMVESIDTRSSVPLSLPYGQGIDGKTLEYTHCGTKFNKSTFKDEDIEFILLHGAKYTKDDWTSSGIPSEMCLKGQPHISVTAVDLSVRSEGVGFRDAFNALVEGKVISGNSIVVISPSASGKAIVSLGSAAAEIGDYEALKKLIKVWIPVASPAVLSVRDDAPLAAFSLARIPVLAINGDQDVMGKKVTKKLESVANAKGVELKGSHAVYLDSPNIFVDTVMDFFSGNEDNSRR